MIADDNKQSFQFQTSEENNTQEILIELYSKLGSYFAEKGEITLEIKNNNPSDSLAAIISILQDDQQRIEIVVQQQIGNNLKRTILFLNPNGEVTPKQNTEFALRAAEEIFAQIEELYDNVIYKKEEANV